MMGSPRNLLSIVATILVASLARAQPASQPDNAGLPVVKRHADMAHSSITFRTQHFGIIDIVGWFEDFDVVLYSESEDFSGAVIEARLSPASVRMPNPDMAGNLRGMFDVENYPDILFVSTSVEPTVGQHYKIVGDLTMKGVTREVEWTGTYNGSWMPPDAGPGFTIHGMIDRLAFGVGDAERIGGQGHMIIGDTVHVICNIRLGLTEPR